MSGLEQKLSPDAGVDRNIYSMDETERKQSHITDLPSTLHNALKELADDQIIKDSMGPYLYQSFMDSKSLEWAAYRQQVSEWEREQYLELY